MEYYIPVKMSELKATENNINDSQNHNTGQKCKLQTNTNNMIPFISRLEKGKTKLCTVQELIHM